MTSSLVGSEMCIRDSSCTLPSAPLKIMPFPRRARWADVTDDDIEAPARSCLLYTSDAADDM
eukprot:2699237-Prorocentrum_lima.AAC.1